MLKQDFTEAGFNVVDEPLQDNMLLNFLKQYYPNVIKDNEIDLQELNNILGLPIDNKVNGYGLNFIGRNFARAKYAQKNDKAVSLNRKLSKNIDDTKNIVLKGDNLDSLKILKNYYSEEVRCIYIDPPYNTTGESFIYPDRFDKEEAEVLGLVNLSEDDFTRMDFSFKTKKSHNGWLTFMYPRLLLAKDLLSKDGVIFISIDDNEQANLKLLCDDVFGEDNHIATFPWRKRTTKSDVPFGVSQDFEWVLAYTKASFEGGINNERKYHYTDDYPNDGWRLSDLTKQTSATERENSAFNMVDPKTNKEYPFNPNRVWSVTKQTFQEHYDNGKIVFPDDYDFLNIKIPAWRVFESEDKAKALKKYGTESAKKALSTFLPNNVGKTADGNKEITNLFGGKIFSHPKPSSLILHFLRSIKDKDYVVLDFFAGSGTTGDAVMQLNAEDGGSRKFILCQIDEPIDPIKREDAYKFCTDNNFAPVISSITLERLNLSGAKIVKDIEDYNSKSGVTGQDKKVLPDIGYKVFDTITAPKLTINEAGQITFPELDGDDLSRVYNMIFTVGIDEPTNQPEVVVDNCIYKVNNNYYLINSDKINQDDFAKAIKNGKVFVDGWTASLSGTLSNFKEEVKIVF